MSINENKNHNTILIKRRNNNNLERQMEYFFPNNQGKNKTIDYGDKEFFKPRIIKNRKIIGSCENNDYNKRQNNNKMAISTNEWKNHNNEENNKIPRIVRNNKDIKKFINNKDYNINQKENINNNYQINKKANNIKRNRSFDNSNLLYNQSKTTQNINNNKDIESNKNDLNKKHNRNSSYDIKIEPKTKEINLLCKNCFDRKMLENEKPENTEVDRIEYLNNKFINENPFYFIDKMNDNEKKRINDKIESNSNKQRLAFANYKKEIDNPKNNTKEKLQLINEYSLNPLSIEVGKDPRYLKQKQNYEKKEKIIHENPDIYKGLEPRKAYGDYYNKCIYQIPKLEESLNVNPSYKENYIKALKKQIEDKKNKEYEDKKKQRMAEAYANKVFNDYKKKANLNQKEKHDYGIEILKNDNKQLNEFKKYKNDLYKQKEKKLANELHQMNDKLNNDIKLRNKGEKSNNIENYQDWLKDIEKKKQAKRESKEEEDKRWNNYIQNYNYKCNHGAMGSCDICNRPYQKDKLKRFPPSSSVMIDFKVK